MPITIDGTNGITQAGEFNSDSSFGFKNRIINGAMVIDQRNAGASVSNGTGVTANFPVDRWVLYGSQSSKCTGQRNAGSVTPPAGFINYLGITSSSAYSILTGDFFTTYHRIEGFNTADLNWGTANAKTITLSFWVRSSLTGTFGGSLTNNAFNRSYPFTYTISTANTWEQKSVTIAGDTSGTWATDNTIGISVYFSLGSGATYSGTAGAWTGSGLFSATGATSVVGTNGATFYITGVQLEVGSTATSFDTRSYGTELALCQRYFINWVGNSTGSVGFPMIGTGLVSSSTTTNIFIPTPVSLRTTPTVSFTGTVSLADGGSASLTSITTIFISTSSGFWGVFVNSGGGLTLGRSVILYAQNASTNSLSASSEL